MRLNLICNVHGDPTLGVPETMIPLEYLGRDECGEIADIDGDPQGVARLADVGVRIGTKVRMVQGGSPCLCELGQTRVSLRLDRRVQVLVLPAS